MKKTILVGIFTTVFLASLMQVNAESCGGEIQCSCGDTLVESYTMNEDLLCGSPGLQIRYANDIVLDCNGYKITGNTEYGHGVYVYYSENTTLRNCDIDNFFHGVLFSYSDYSVLEDSTIEERISTSGSNGVTFSRNTIENAFLCAGENHIIEGNTFNSAGGLQNVALNLECSGANITGNTFTTSSRGGIGIYSQQASTGNTIDENVIEGFSTGIMLGSALQSPSTDNIIVNNNITGNDLAVLISKGDLNILANNEIDSGSVIINEPPIDGGNGFDFVYSLNNILYNNDIWDESNTWDIENNLYCYDGIENTYHFTAPECTPEIQEDCIPTCNLTLDDGGGWFGGGSLLETGWQEWNYKDAIHRTLKAHPPGTGLEPVNWHVHTLPSKYEVFVWKFEHRFQDLMATNAKYTITHARGTTVKYIDWTTPGNEWISLGTYTFLNDPEQGIELSDEADGYVIADALIVKNIGPADRTHKLAIKI